MTERTLVAAMMRQALEDATRPSEPQRSARKKGPMTKEEKEARKERKREILRLRGDARAWFTRMDNRPFSFSWCCDILDIDGAARVDLIRRAYGVKSLRVRRVAATRRAALQRWKQEARRGLFQ